MPRSRAVATRSPSAASGSVASSPDRLRAASLPSTVTTSVRTSSGTRCWVERLAKDERLKGAVVCREAWPSDGAAVVEARQHQFEGSPHLRDRVEDRERAPRPAGRRGRDIGNLELDGHRGGVGQLDRGAVPDTAWEPRMRPAMDRPTPDWRFCSGAADAQASSRRRRWPSCRDKPVLDVVALRHRPRPDRHGEFRQQRAGSPGLRQDRSGRRRDRTCSAHGGRRLRPGSRSRSPRAPA